MHPPLWPLFDDVKTPVLSIERLVRRAAHKHPGQRGVVISFAGRGNGLHGDVLRARVNGFETMTLVGARERPYFVALDDTTRWIVRAAAHSDYGAAPFGKCEATLRDLPPGRVDWVHFVADGRGLTCQVATVRPA